MVLTKETTLDKNESKQLIQHFFELFQNWCNQSSLPSKEELEKYLTDNFQLISNDKLICKDCSDYAQRLGGIQNKYSHLSLSKFLEEPLICGDKMVVRYNVDFTLKDGQKGQINVMAITKIQDKKFSSWTEVMHEKGTRHLHS